MSQGQWLRLLPSKFTGIVLNASAAPLTGGVDVKSRTQPFVMHLEELERAHAWNRPGA